MTISLDLIDSLARLPAGGPVTTLRRQRETARAATQACFDTLFDSAQPVPDLSPLERELAALRTAALAQDAALAALHRSRARDLGAEPDAQGGLPGAEGQPPNARLSAVLGFVDRLALRPAAAGPEHLALLTQQGLSPAAIVTLAQVVAFVSYQTRLLAGLRALQAAGPAAAHTAAATPAQEAVAGTHPTAHAPLRHGSFTLDELAWQAWLPTVDVTRATPEQLAVLDESHATARTSPYYLTLLHHPPLLRQRSRLFNAVMYERDGLPRADRELTTVAVSRINGCPYCASVHARLFAQLSKEPAVIEAIYQHGVNAPLSARRRALVDLAADLSAAAPALAGGRVDQLRGAGLADLEILDAIHAAALFAWANRLMQTLGQPVGPGQA
jgi:uncharacterized peroxidase-related enzyme